MIHYICVFNNCVLFGIQICILFKLCCIPSNCVVSYDNIQSANGDEANVYGVDKCPRNLQQDSHLKDDLDFNLNVNKIGIKQNLQQQYLTQSSQRFSNNARMEVCTSLPQDALHLLRNKTMPTKEVA